MVPSSKNQSIEAFTMWQSIKNRNAELKTIELQKRYPTATLEAIQELVDGKARRLEGGKYKNGEKVFQKEYDELLIKKDLR